MNLIRFLGAMSAIILTAGVQAQGLPTPKITKADPQMIYPNSAGWLDSFGRVIVYLQGENLAPDETLSHPTGPDGGYQHIFVRNVSAKNVAGPWVPAVWDNGARVLGACAKSVIQLGVDPRRFLGAPGSHLQVKLWVSLGADGADDPSRATNQASAWSPIFTVDVAPPGSTKPVPPPAKPEVPTISRLNPAELTVAPSTNYKIRVYGQYLCGDDNRVVFNGEAGAAVPAEDHCKGYDDDGSFLKGGEALFHVTIPERYRKPGTLTVTVVDSEGQSNVATLTLKALTLKPIQRPITPETKKIQPAANPGILRK